MKDQAFSQARLRELIRQSPRLSPMDLQAKLNVPELEIMVAMADEAVEVPVARLNHLLEQIRGWGEVLSLIRNRDAVSELKFQAGSLYRRDEWLNAIEVGYNLHIRIAATARILLLIRLNHTRQGQTYSVNFANTAGDVFWRIYAQSPVDRASFRQLMDTYRSGM